MSKKVLVLAVTAVVVLLMIGIMGAAIRKSNKQKDTASSEEELSTEVIIPSEMPQNISLTLPPGFQETSSDHYNKYYVMNDASIIVTGEKLVIHGQRLDEYAASVKKQYERSADAFQIISEGDMKSGAPCKTLEFTYALIGEDARQDFQCVTAILLKDDYAYLVTCKSKKETFMNYRGAFLNTISKITIADAQPEPAQSGVRVDMEGGEIGADSSGFSS